MWPLRRFSIALVALLAVNLVTVNGVRVGSGARNPASPGAKKGECLVINAFWILDLSLRIYWMCLLQSDQSAQPSSMWIHCSTKNFVEYLTFMLNTFTQLFFIKIVLQNCIFFPYSLALPMLLLNSLCMEIVVLALDEPQPESLAVF